MWTSSSDRRAPSVSRHETHIWDVEETHGEAPARLPKMRKCNPKIGAEHIRLGRLAEQSRFRDLLDDARFNMPVMDSDSKNYRYLMSIPILRSSSKFHWGKALNTLLKMPQLY